MLIFPRKILTAFFFYILIIPQALAGVNPDSIPSGKTKDTVYVRKFIEEQFFCTNDYNSPDTLLDNLQRYFPKNSLGNPGTALTPMLLKSETRQTGFTYWPSNFDYYFFNRKNVEYLNTRNPYTNVYLASGTKEEQYFKAKHSQNITPQLNMAVSFNKLRSHGDYLRQAGNHTNVSLSSNYLSKDGNYFLLGNILYNKLRVQENGGIADDTEFEEAGFSDKKLIEVNLRTAQRGVWNKGAYLKQGIAYGTSSNHPIPDSSKAKKYSKGFISHSIAIEDNSIVFLDSDPDTDYYESILRDSIQTRDSVYYWKIENEFAWAINSTSGSVCRPKFKIAFAHQFSRVKQFEIDSVMQNIIAKAEYNRRGQRTLWSVSGEYLAAGSQRGELYAKSDVKYRLQDSTSFIGVSSNFSISNPEFIFNRYLSNHYEWSYNWNKYKVATSSLIYSSKKLKLIMGVSAYYYNAPLYFDVKARPKQYSGSITAYSAFVKKSFNIGKWVFANTVRYQHIPDSTIIRLPAIVSENAIYYENSLFNNALRIQAGVDIYYTSSFMGNAYMPVTGQYHIQNEETIGNYPYADLFVNLKIRTVRFFLKYEHANAGLIGNRYYLVPHHPLFDASFVFGLSWDFYN
jgi:hypothetical protein